MAAQLKDIKGRFLMSINDVPQIREIFAAFHMIEVSTTYSISKSSLGSGQNRELLVSNIRIQNT